MKHQLFFSILIFVFGIGPDLEAAEIYQWIDKDGVQHFTDGPPPPGAQIVEDLSETPAIEPPANNGATTPKDPGSVEGEENSSPDREEYWRRKGWENGSNGRGEPGAAQSGENDPILDRKIDLTSLN